MEYTVGRIIYGEKEIRKRVWDLAAQIRNDFREQEIQMVGILKGCAIFMSDLARAIGNEVDARLDFMIVSSYGVETRSSGVVRIVKDLDFVIENKNVIIVEDIVDTGLTVSYLINVLRQRSPACLKVCSLLNKGERRKVAVELDYCGFDIGDSFVVGYGLDCGGRWRHLPDIHEVVPLGKN
jgi:hypoxanthine phosphoribosyltransferase